MLISIIIPAYNAEQTIEKCLDAILIQVQDMDYEIIIVDDGSTDRTKDKVINYNNNNIIYLWQENSKQSVARNNGLKHASGKYVFFFDADDIIDHYMIPKMIGQIERSNTDLVICGIKKIFTNNASIQKEINELFSALETSPYPCEAFLAEGKELDAGLWNKVFKRSIINKNNIFFENGNFFEDSLFVLNYLLSIKNGISFIHEPLYFLFKRGGSTTTQYNNDIIRYATHYLAKAECACHKKNIFLSTKTKNAFLLRLYIHVFHHHVKYSPSWGQDEVSLLKSAFNITTITCFLNNLPLKYKVSSIVMFFFPRGYSYIYNVLMK